MIGKKLPTHLASHPLDKVNCFTGAWIILFEFSDPETITSTATKQQRKPAKNLQLLTLF
jgi:hypothetical protein